jgi:hypothetical protein
MKRASNSERVKASRLRRKPSLTPKESAWLNRYQQAHPVRATPQPATDTPPATPEKTRVTDPLPVSSPDTSESFEAPPPPTLDDGNALPDLRDLDGPPPAPPAEPLSIAPMLPDDSPHGEGLGCGGVCPTCRGKKPKPRCSLSGDVIPVPLDARESEALASAVFTAIAAGIYLATQEGIESPNELQKANARDAIARLSVRHDMSGVSDLTPYVMAATVFGGHAANQYRRAKARKVAKGKPRPLFSAPPSPTS